MRDETVNVIQIHGNEWCAQIFETFGNNCSCGFFPHADLSISTLRIAPAVWQGLWVIDTIHWPEANSCSMTVGPAITMPLLVWFCRALRSKQMAYWAVPTLGFGISARGSASSHHVTHATANDVGLICSQEDVCHLSRTPTAC
jgi:hypothetical protein